MSEKILYEINLSALWLTRAPGLDAAEVLDLKLWDPETKPGTRRSCVLQPILLSPSLRSVYRLFRQMWYAWKRIELGMKKPEAISVWSFKTLFLYEYFWHPRYWKLCLDWFYIIQRCYLKTLKVPKNKLRLPSRKLFFIEMKMHDESKKIHHNQKNCIETRDVK